MSWLIASIIITCTLYGIFGFKVDKTRDILYWEPSRRQFLAILGLVALIPGFITKIPANSVGIKYSAFSGTQEQTLSEGLKVKSLFDKIYTISTEVQTRTVEGLTAQTKDAQYVTTTLDVKYRVNPANAYIVFTQFRTLENMSETLIVPTVQRVLEMTTTKYNVMDVLGEQRTQIYMELEAELAKEFAKYGVDYYSISITDMDAGIEIESAITAEAVAKKDVETAAQELEKARIDAQQKSVTAQAEQDAARIKAETKRIEAEAEKAANDLLIQSLTDKILTQQWIEKWNGEVPTYYGGDGADLIFNTVTE